MQKKFDFVVKTEQKYYLIETNFYTTQGSKLNETARSYKELALEFKDLDNIDFVWITDGKGWQTTKKNLQETFNNKVSSVASTVISCFPFTVG